MNRRTLLAVIPSTILITGCTSDENASNQSAEYDEVKKFTVRNGLNESINATIVVRDLDTGTVLSETNITAPKYQGDDGGVEANKSIPTADESGNYRAEITVEGRGTVTTEFNLRTPVGDAILYIKEAASDEDEPFRVSVDEAADV